MARSQTELLPGTLDMLVLQTVASGAKHGYAIAKHIRTMSRDVLDVEQGSLYPALFRMHRKGWIKPKWGTSETGRRVKFYSLTRAGRRQLEERETDWKTLVRAIQRVMSGA